MLEALLPHALPSEDGIRLAIVSAVALARVGHRVARACAVIGETTTGAVAARLSASDVDNRQFLTTE